MLSSGVLYSQILSSVMQEYTKINCIGKELVKDYTVNINTPAGMWRVLRGLFSWSLTSGQKLFHQMLVLL